MRCMWACIGVLASFIFIPLATANDGHPKPAAASGVLSSTLSSSPDIRFAPDLYFGDNGSEYINHSQQTLGYPGHPSEPGVTIKPARHATFRVHIYSHPNQDPSDVLGNIYTNDHGEIIQSSVLSDPSKTLLPLRDGFVHDAIALTVSTTISEPDPTMSS